MPHSFIPPVPRCHSMVSSGSCGSVWDSSSLMVVLGAAQVSCLPSASSCLLPLLGFLSSHALLDWDRGTPDCQANRGPEALTAPGCVRPTHLPIPLPGSDFLLKWCVSDLQIWELTHVPPLGGIPLVSSRWQVDGAASEGDRTGSPEQRRAVHTTCPLKPSQAPGL